LWGAEAWKFAASEQGLPDYDNRSDNQGSYRSYTPYYRMRNASVNQVASWLKSGMPAQLHQNGNDELRGYGVPLPNGGITGPYNNLPLR